ncbi:MAG: N-acetylmuramoyl-L-alanine amidase [Desulfovibrio sp.]|jgi:N-acetylmuramoyl-L-alanine amidase|nr:N-acetylmuramoyl-L-alanine amidase [Desulfovibrio sp.]
MRDILLFFLASILSIGLCASELEAAQRQNPKAGAQGKAASSARKAKPAAQKPAAAQKQPPPPVSDADQKTNAVLKQLGLTVQTIMIDAGHGGKDPGAQAFGLTEKNFTLDMARRVGDSLRKKGFTVIFTRSGNNYLSLQERPDAANAKKADLFISIHANANPNPARRGLETYYLSEAKSNDAVTVAARENGVPVQEISDLQFILTDLMLSSKVKESRHLAECAHKGILGSLRKARVSVLDNGVRAAPFYVLVGARMPAILVEFGYISNKDDAANLKRDSYLQKQSDGLAEGILQYKKELAANAPG